jgi:Tfp pilus assembly protein PilF
MTRKDFSKKLRLAIFFISLATMIIYANSLGNEFVFDDHDIFVNREEITSFKYLPEVLGFTKGEPHYRPIRLISYMVDHFFFGSNPLGYHLFNILYHVISSTFVYLIAFLITQNYRLALFTAIVFAVHPIQTESVTYLSGRRDILSGLFYFMGFYYFLRYRSLNRIKYACFVFISYILGIFSKEMAVTLPATLFCYDFIDRFHGPGYFKGIWKATVETFTRSKYLYTGLFACAALFSLYKTTIDNPSHAEGYYGGSIIPNFLTVAKILVHYIKLLFFPITLNADYSFNAFPVVNSIFEFQAILSVLIIIVIFLLILRSITINKAIAFAGMWFFITLLPVCHILPHHDMMAEHYLYLPMFGFSFFSAVLVDNLLSRDKKKLVVYAIFGLVVLLFSLRTIERNRDWKDDLTLWHKTVETSPDCARARNNLGKALVNRGHLRKAIIELNKAIEIKPHYEEAFCNRGVAFGVLKMHNEATNNFKKALEINPRFAEAYYNLGLTLAKTGAFDEANKQFQSALKIKPDLSAAHYNSGIIYRKIGDMQKALYHFNQVIEIDPDGTIATKVKNSISDLRGK